MPDSLTVEILDVTPEMAETWLSKNPNNRNLRSQVIASYARDMAAGSWVLNGETVKIYPPPAISSTVSTASAPSYTPP